MKCLEFQNYLIPEGYYKILQDHFTSVIVFFFLSPHVVRLLKSPNTVTCPRKGWNDGGYWDQITGNIESSVQETCSYWLVDVIFLHVHWANVSPQGRFSAERMLLSRQPLLIEESPKVAVQSSWFWFLLLKCIIRMEYKQACQAFRADTHFVKIWETWEIKQRRVRKATSYILK